jgi:eukaryotic-like serine/threonine-protein kinase
MNPGSVISDARRSAEAWVDVPGLLQQARDFEFTGHVRAAEAAYDAVIVSAARQDDHPALAEAFRRRAIMAHQCGDSSRARSGLQQSYAVAAMLGNRRLMAETLNALGGLELETRNLAAAETALGEALNLAGEHPPVVARVAQNLGIVANIRGDLPAAESHYRRSLAAFESLGDPGGSAITLHNLGMLTADRGAHDEACALYRECERLADGSGDAHLAALCRVNHAESLLALGEVSEGRATVELAGRSLEALGSRFDAPDVERVLALCERAEGSDGEAETRLGRARELAQLTDARLTDAEIARDLGRLYAQTGRPMLARRAFREAVDAFGDLGATAEARVTRLELETLGGN